MKLGGFDIAVFVAFYALIFGVSLWKSRRESSSEDYFLAGRSLPWWIIGISIVAANISTEQFVGMAGQGAGGVGLAVSNWQLLGSVAVVLIAFTLLPRFLKAGIYTMPEFLEYRYNAATRSIMAAITVVIYVAVMLTAVLYSGGLTLQTIFGVPLAKGIWMIGLIAVAYTAWGGLKAVAWADLFQGGALLVGGIVTFLLGLHAVGGWDAFATANAEKLHMVLPADHKDLPWVGVLGGMWIVELYYCGLNQFIVQRNLAAKTLRDGQLGVLFAGGLWLLVPFAIVMPGMMAGQLFSPELREAADTANRPVVAAIQASTETRAVPFDADFAARAPDLAARALAHNEALAGFTEAEGDIVARNSAAVAAASARGHRTAPALVGTKHDAAFPALIRKLVPAGVRGFMFAAIAGAVISSLASMLNSAATISTMDIYHRLIDRNAPQKRLVGLGRLLTVLFVVIACLLAPRLDDPKFGGVFTFIQQFQGYIWPGVVAVFVFGLLVPAAPGAAGVAGMLAGPVLYGLLQFLAKDLHFLVQVAIVFQLVLFIMGLITLVAPRAEPKTLPVRADLDTTTAPVVLWAGAAVLAGVAVFYAVFW